ncbi:MAG: transposase [Nitrospirota bacterium]
MARKPRIEYNGAFYHVITRGNQRQKIFKEPVDYQQFLQVLATYKSRYSFHLYAYVLMGNHVHLLIETKETPLSKILQGINQSYTLYFNRRYKTVGHLFQGRYKAILCDREAYLLGLLKYIHTNPVRARIAETPGVYRWSSHPAYTGKNNLGGLIDTDQVLRMFSENKARARRQYKVFMNDTMNLRKEEVYSTIDQRLQGDEEFVDRVLTAHDFEIKKERKKKEYSLQTIRKTVEKLYQVTLDQLRSSGKDRHIMRARRVFAATAKEYGYQGKEIAKYLEKDPASVSGYLRGEDVSSEVVKAIRQLGDSSQNVNAEV